MGMRFSFHPTFVSTVSEPHLLWNFHRSIHKWNKFTLLISFLDLNHFWGFLWPDMYHFIYAFNCTDLYVLLLLTSNEILKNHIMQSWTLQRAKGNILWAKPLVKLNTFLMLQWFCHICNLISRISVSLRHWLIFFSFNSMFLSNFICLDLTRMFGL